MRYTTLLSILILLVFSGCDKEKFNTTPTLHFESVSSTELRPGQIIQFTLSFTDAEGDLKDSIYIKKVVPDCIDGNLDQLYPIPSFPTSKDQKGEILVTYGYNAGTGYQNIAPQCPPKNDTATFYFVLRDEAGHTSDTISSPQIILYY